MTSRVLPLYRLIASIAEARLNCQANNNAEWFDRHSERLDYIARELLPSGAGVDSGSKIDLERTTAGKIVLTTAYHHMNDGGMYDGWTEHAVVVTPCFDGIDVRVTGRDRNDVKDYLGDLFHANLTSLVEETADCVSFAKSA